MLVLSKEEERRARDLHKKLILINGLQPPAFTDEWLAKLRDQGLTACNYCISGAEGREDLRTALRHVTETHDRLHRMPDIITQVKSVQDIKDAKKDGKLGLALGFQAPDPIENDLGLLRVFHKLGLKFLQLTYQERNLVGDGCGERTDSGLSNFGIKVVEELNRLGIAIDLSHVGHKTTMEAIELSKDPVIFSHAGVLSVESTRPANLRNKSDEEIKAMAEKGGVIGLIAYSPYVKHKEIPTIKDYMNHLEYAVNLVGVDHVGIGLDGPAEEASFTGFAYQYPELALDYGYTWANILVTDLNGPGVSKGEERLVNLARGLVSRGYSDQEIRKIYGDNFLRVFQKVWKE